MHTHMNATFIMHHRNLTNAYCLQMHPSVPIVTSFNTPAIVTSAPYMYSHVSKRTQSHL